MSTLRDKCHVLPVPSTDITHVDLDFTGRHLELRFDYRTGASRRRCRYRFDGVRAHRHRAELYCTADLISAAYDQLVEVDASEWIEELLRAAPDDQRGSWPMHHYMIYFDSNGCYEVVAADWTFLSSDD